MFRPGEVFKVKIESSPDSIGFGRATVLETERGHMLFRLKNSRGDKQIVPRGTRVWFVGNLSDNRLNGLWSSVVTDMRLFQGHPAIECKAPVFEPFSAKDQQRRRHVRAALQVPVLLEGEQWQDLEDAVVSRNVSRSGIGLSVLQQCPQRFACDLEIDIILQTATVDVKLRARVINATYNWLSNRTDVGLEFTQLPQKSIVDLDRILAWLGSRTRKETGEVLLKPEAGALAAWLKTAPEDHSLLRLAHGALPPDAGLQSVIGEDVEPEDFESTSEREDSGDKR